MNLMEQLIELSRRYGGNEEYVLAGGGNTSYKENGVLYVKGSGTQLATIDESGFVKMDANALTQMLDNSYPEDDKAREAAALVDMMAAKAPGQEAKRPSVECILHALFPYTFVLHVHPALVNGLTCGQNGQEACRRLFGSQAVWIGLTKPGYVLGKTCHTAFAEYKKAQGAAPKLLFMQNHGIIVAADTVEEIDRLMEMVMAKLAGQVEEKPDFSPADAAEGAALLAPALRMLYAGHTRGAANAVYCANPQALAFAESARAMAPLMLPYTPDQIVYCKGTPLYLPAGANAAAEFTAFTEKHGYAPKVVFAEGMGFFALGKTKKEADIARLLVLDTMKVAVYAKAFGGPLPLTEEFTRFILNWEAESYRQQVALSAGESARLKGKIAIVTGAAQGFGEGIARGIAAQGGYVIIADMNAEGANRLAEELNAAHGAGTAMGAQVNVADDESVKAMVAGAALAYGGLDIMVSCAGILVAGSLVDMTKANFDKVTAVNYTGYFLCAKYASAVMKVQSQTLPGYTMDIVEINSKSGLEGSKANFAYAGSKFGGVGLTQSFALELAEFGIKVNAICPGNLLDGPLWSDPVRGLFKQYLDAGKVPGAKTVADVRSFYEGKVPLGRGCTVADVVKALTYIIEQQYETGQAVPVTGGQVMLN